MALMGFVTGALSDVMKRREQTRLEEAEARKEARLAAIRAEERNEDRAFSREQFNAQQEALNARDERNFDQQKEYFGMSTAEADKRDERNFAQQRQLAAEQRAASAAEAAAGRKHSEKLAGMRSPQERAPKIEAFVGERSGRTVNFDLNQPKHVAALQKWQQTESVRPAAAAGVAQPDYGQMGQPAARAPRGADMVWDAKAGRLVPASR